MNLLFVHAHDVGRYISPYGHALRTPHLQRFAGEAVTFRDAHCAAPTCSPSRAAMWTGKTAHETGMLGLVHRGFDLSDRREHFMRVLSREGYRTALSGLQHEYDPDSPDAIYDELLATEPRPLEDRDYYAADCAARFMEKPPTEPWALSVGFFYPHRDFLKAEPGEGDFLKVPDPLPDTPVVRQDFADYAVTVEEMDRCFGRVMAGLEASGQKDRTVVVFTTDHGIAFPEMKCQLTAHGTGVSLLVRDPRNKRGTRIVDELVSHLDLPATLADILGVEGVEAGHGRSLRGLMTGSGEPVRDDLFAEVNFHAAAEPARSVRTKRFNYIVRFEHDLRQPWANVDDGASKSFWMEDVRGTGRMEKVRLYDLLKDPQERHNLAADPEYSEIRDEMSARLHRWMEATKDPLLEGPLGIPEGARVNTRESIDPRNGPFVEEPLPAGLVLND